MSKAVLISIRPEWCEKIASGQKLSEIRKNRPKIDVPFKCYIYKTKHKWIYSLLRFLGKDDLADSFEQAQGKVIAEFICDRIHEFKVFEDGCVQDWYFGDLNKSCLTTKEVAEYIGRDHYGYSWHLSDLVIYDKPKELSEFSREPPCTYDRGEYCSFPYKCRKSGDKCKGTKLTRPPQSWCYVEET